MSDCPVCGAEVEFDRFQEGITCPKCNSALRAAHDCHYNHETGDEWCSDWLEVDE